MEVSELLEELMTKEVPAIMEPLGALRFPKVPPAVFLETRIIEEAVTAVVLIVIVPDERAALVPTEALAPVAIESLFPAVPRTKFPLVAVIAPEVAVRVVVVVREPGVVIAEGRDQVIVEPDPVVVI